MEHTPTQALLWALWRLWKGKRVTIVWDGEGTCTVHTEPSGMLTIHDTPRALAPPE